jgi:UDP-glucose 4-epimerase
MINYSYLNQINGSNVLITGGLGFVGHNLAKTLIKDYSCKITILDNLLNSNECVLKNIEGHCDIIKESVIDFGFEGFLEKFDYVFHLACIQIAHSGKNPYLDLETNALSTLRILEYYRNNRGNLKRFIYTSSASVYGNGQNGLCVETGPTKVLSQYAATKLLGENYTMLYFKQYGVPTSSVR